MRGINAFTLALRSVNPKAEVKVVWVNTWYDPAKEGDAAKALIDQGADVISQHADSPAPLQVAESRGAFAIGQASDMKRFAPKAQLMAIVDDWNPYYVARTKAAMEGTCKSQDTWDGIEPGMVVVASINKSLPDNVRAKAMQAVEDLKSGKVHAFDGPVKDQSGKVRVPAGEHASGGCFSVWIGTSKVYKANCLNNLTTTRNEKGFRGSPFLSATNSHVVARCVHYLVYAERIIPFRPARPSIRRSQPASFGLVVDG